MLLLILAVCVCILSIGLPSIVAQISLTKALAQSPQDTSFLVQQANQLYQSGKFTEAVQVWRQAAIAFASQKNYLNQASLEIAQRWKSPQDISKVWLNLGNTNRALAKREETFKDTNKANIYTQEALVAYQQAAIATSPLVKIQALLNQRNLLIDQQQWEAAEQLLSPIRESLKFLAQLSPSPAALYAKIKV
ncbi:hypothetical protein LC593_06450 [Nostoc sp. CHAB 5844]|nr:hypothetical protein [Nostoc sp. CHAB 5844]